MEEEITKSMFEILARTGALALSEDESERLRCEMNRQMRIIHRLEAIPLDDNLDPVIHGNPYPKDIRCGLRQDIPVPFDNASGILAQVPHTIDGYIVSPDVPHQKI